MPVSFKWPWDFKEFKFGATLIWGGISSIIETITGSAPLSLPNAVTRAISSITQTGKCEQANTPTPNAPVDIYCNNGKLKYGVLGKNLFNPNYYQGDGWYIASNDTVATANSNGTLVMPCKPNTTYSWWHTNGSGGERAFELTTDTITQGQPATWAVSNPAYNNVMTIRKYTTSADAKLLCVLFARVDANNVGRTIEEQLADFMLVEGDITTATDYEPYKGMGIYADGTPEVLWVDNGNILPPNAIADVKYPVKRSGACVVSCDVNNGSNVLAVEVHYYKADGTQINYYTLSSYDDTTHRMYKSFSLASTAAYVSIERKAAYSTATVTNLKLEMGSTLTPYVQPTGVASAENLFGVGDYADTQDIISGAVTRKYGVKVFDGTESWTLASNSDASGNNVFFTPFADRAVGANNFVLFCTHYTQAPAGGYASLTTGKFLYSTNSTNIQVYFDGGTITSKNDWQAYLAAQYAAGTPVIVVYPLATPITESVAGQSLSTTQGINVVNMMAEVSNIPLEIKYSKAS